jgi:hypothetical protein
VKNPEEKLYKCRSEGNNEINVRKEGYEYVNWI